MSDTSKPWKAWQEGQARFEITKAVDSWVQEGECDPIQKEHFEVEVKAGSGKAKPNKGSSKKK